MSETEKVWTWIKNNPNTLRNECIKHFKKEKISNPETKIDALTRRGQLTWSFGYPTALGNTYMSEAIFKQWLTQQSKGNDMAIITTPSEKEAIPETKAAEVQPSYAVVIEGMAAEALEHIQINILQQMGFKPTKEQVVDHALYLTSTIQYKGEQFQIPKKTTSQGLFIK